MSQFSLILLCLPLWHSLALLKLGSAERIRGAGFASATRIHSAVKLLYGDLLLVFVSQLVVLPSASSCQKVSCSVLQFDVAAINFQIEGFSAIFSAILLPLLARN